MEAELKKKQEELKDEERKRDVFVKCLRYVKNLAFD
jgi:hypothetical protein